MTIHHVKKHVKKHAKHSALATAAAALAIGAAVAPDTWAKGGGHGGHSHSASYGPGHESVRCAGCARDARGRIERSHVAVEEFERTHPCPGNRSDYIVDHIVPLKRGGSDTPDNMQWQTKEEAKAKDAVE